MRIYHFCFALDASKGGVPHNIIETSIQLSRRGIYSNIFSSGNSKNIIDGVLEAKKKGMQTIALTGFDGGKLISCVDNYVL